MIVAAPAAWLVRAGRAGERERAALGEGLAIAGWDELGDIGNCRSKEELRELVRRTYSGEGKALIANWTGQLWRFLNTIQVGDHVVLPLKSRTAVAIGRIAGPYSYRSAAPEGFRHVRPVQWVRTDIPRDAIRQDLLDSMGSLLTICGLTRFDAARRIAHLAEHGTDPGPPQSHANDNVMESSSDLLANAADRHANDPLKLSIRNFLSHWDSARRTPSVVARIEGDLSEKGLTTRPPFTEGWINNTIEIVPLGAEPVVGESSSPSQKAADTKDVSEIPPVTLRIGDLEAANREVTSVTADASLEKVVTIMIRKDYSQLAVVSSEGSYEGVVSWESIGQARISRREVTLVDARTDAPRVDHTALLLDQIDTIYNQGFVLVLNQDKSTLSGIVTAADLTQQFGNLARPFVLIEEAERRLRAHVDATFTLDELRSSLPRNRASRVRSAADLTLGNYHFLLNDDSRWRKLRWNIDREEFLRDLWEVREIRNDAMHFNPDPLTDAQLTTLRGFVDLLRMVDPHT